MKHTYPSTIQTARETIYSQKGLLMGIRRSAWLLFEIQLKRTDPDTGELYTPYKALDNTLKWMAEQAEMLERVRHEPTQMQRRLLQMLVDGKTQKEISYELGINSRTIRTTLSRLRSRIGASTMYQVVAVATKKGWVRWSRTGNTHQRIRAIR
jgi:DNA-binding CsgD family transcriptional regulator